MMIDKQFSDTASSFVLSTLSRRKCERERSDHALIGSIVLPETAETMEVWVRDLSAEGIGLTTSRPIEVGTSVLVGLKRSKTVRANPFRAQVVYCTPESDCCWCVGCLFETPLDLAVLQYLVG